MLADALAQYLVWKRWRRWFLVVGPSPGDKMYAEAVRWAAQRFGAEIVVDPDSTGVASLARRFHHTGSRAQAQEYSARRFLLLTAIGPQPLAGIGNQHRCMSSSKADSNTRIR